MADYSYLGSGRIYVEEIGAAVPAGPIELGNCSALSLAVNEETKESKDYTQPGGGTFNEVRRISSVEMQVTQAELKPDGLARALYGAVTAIASSVVVGEARTVYPDAYVPFANLPLTTPVPTIVPAQATAAARANTTPYALNAYYQPAVANGYYYKVTTAGTSAAAPPTFPVLVGATVVDGTATVTCAGKIAVVAGVDYELRAGGLLTLPGATIAGEVWTVGYTRAAIDLVQALVNSAREYKVIFDGLNEARSGKRTRITAYRVKLGAAQNISLIGDDYASLEVTGKLLKDTTITGAGLSQYVKIEVER